MIANQATTIKSDLIRNWFFLIILLLSFTPGLAAGYSVYALVVLFPILVWRRFFPFTVNFILILIFSVAYAFAAYSHDDMSMSNFVMNLIFPLIAYLSGDYICERFDNKHSWLLVVILLVLSMGTLSFLDCVDDTIQTGNIINTSRTIGVNPDQWEKDLDVQAISPTNIGVLVSLMLGTFGIVFYQTEAKIEVFFKWIIAMSALMGVFVTIHLVNRTGLLLLVLGSVLALFRPPVNHRKIIVSIGVLVCILVIFIIIFNDSKLVQFALQSYAERNNVAGYGVASAGGRDVRWLAAISQIPARPFGDRMLDFPGEANYAHNMWLDAGVIGGWIPFVMLIIIGIRFITTVYRVVKYSNIDQFSKTYIILFSVTIILQSAVEPIIQSQFPYLVMLILFWGMLIGIEKKYS